jgi:glucosamine-phosphate N-acetyltransferase
VKVPPTPFKEDLQFRLLQESDYDGAFLGLLRQLTTVGDVTSEQFCERARKAREDPNTFIVVIEDTTQVWGFSSLNNV